MAKSRQKALRGRRSKKKLPKGYDSWFEVSLHREALRSCECHTAVVEYTQTKQYTPDFIYQDNDKVIYIEAKGRFRDRHEARKYIDIVSSLPENTELVFIFADPDKPMPGAQVRKDRTKQTHGQWAAKNGIRYYTEHNTPREWAVGRRKR